MAACGAYEVCKVIHGDSRADTEPNRCGGAARATKATRATAVHVN